MRYFVLKEIRVDKTKVLKPGDYASKELIDSVYGQRIKMAIRSCCLIDLEFEYDFNRFDRNKIIKRMRLLGAIATKESKKVAASCVKNFEKTIGDVHSNFYMSKYSAELENNKKEGVLKGNKKKVLTDTKEDVEIKIESEVGKRHIVSENTKEKKPNSRKKKDK